MRVIKQGYNDGGLKGYKGGVDLGPSQGRLHHVGLCGVRGRGWVGWVDGIHTMAAGATRPPRPVLNSIDLGI